MAELPTVAGGYPCVLADPPWTHVMRSPKGINSRHPSAHYATMPIGEIRALPVADVVASNAWLFLWTTWPHLVEALSVIDAWGFRYSSNFVTWVKLNPRRDGALMFNDADFHMGSGYTSRKNTEVILLGRRGRPKRLSGGVRELLIAPRREHSRKPAETFTRIEAFCPGPRLEMFSREPRAGWAQWGDQTELFSAA